MAKSGYQKIPVDVGTENTSFLSLLLFQWMNIAFKTGNERALEDHDFLPLSEENTSCSVMEKLQTEWEKEKARCKEDAERPKLWKSLLKTLSFKNVIVLIFTTGSYSVCRILIQPFLLGYLVTSLMSAEPHKSYILYGCALAMGMNALIMCLSMHHYDYQCELVGVRFSSALKGLIYLKTLLLSKDTLFKFSTGHVIDLVSNDVQRLEGDAIKLFFSGNLTFIEVVTVSVLLVYLFGWPAMMGVFVFAVLLPFYIVFSFIGAGLRTRTAAVSDQRLSLMNQVVSGIRAIKLHAWEDEYRKQLKATRSHEISIIRKKSTLLSGFVAIDYTSAPIATMVSIVSLVLTGQPLTPFSVFMLLLFINLLSTSICFNLGYTLLTSFDAYASLGRIEQFLLLENLSRERNSAKSANRWIDHQKEMGNTSLDKQTILCVSSLGYKQMQRDDEFILQDIDLVAASESLTVITGPVGSGKSILLSIIAGELSSTNGSISCKGTIVYVPQIAWIFSGTLRENILFGEPCDETKYTRIIEACALTEDIQQFPNCDETVVGERGEVLSGGQRARVSLARAVYADADLYLLDDPLSAVDSKVGEHIFVKCIKGLLGHKTRVFTTHQEKHMKEADKLIVLYKGRVLGEGSFTELKAKGFLNTIADPLYKNLEDANDTFDEEMIEEDEVFGDEESGTIMSQNSEGRGLQISEEDRMIGAVSANLYWTYFKSGIHPLAIIAIICLFLFTQGIIVAPDVWLSFMTKKRPEDQQDKTNLIIYGVLVNTGFIFAILRAQVFLLASLKCSESLHDRMVTAALQAPVLFFDSNPVGRIMNRFSKDIGCLDEVLPKYFLVANQTGLIVLTAILVPTVANPWLLFAVMPMIALVVYISRYYLKTSRELKRLESICRSPVFSHFAETLNGLDTIRTRGREKEFVNQFHSYQDVHNQSLIMVKAGGRWLGVRLDLLISLFIGTVAIVAVLISQDAAFAGLALVYVIQAATIIQYVVRLGSDVENYMTSAERVIAYTKIDSEPGYKVEQRNPEHWPHEGNITFKNVSLTYYPGGPEVLKKINLSITGGAKIGVAGRTGAGKSSFVAALMRMPDADGDITVDGIRIKDINLLDSRRSISVLGQSPVLFSGSVRKNLDPLGQFQDTDLWRALEDVRLKDLVESLEGQLGYELLEHGVNVSVGERQLICLARVLLQQRKIIVLDEPTAHVDPNTEQAIWNVVREKLRNCTVITIAHRLNTIRDCDMILVFKSGKIDQFDKFDAFVKREKSRDLK